MSDTPRTDALRDSSDYPTPRGELWQFAATLERELVAMKSENDEFHKLLSEQQANWEKDLKKCSDELARATESSMAGLRREQQRLADELRSVTAERDELRKDFSALQRSLVGQTSASAILTAEKLISERDRMRPVVKAAQKWRADWTPAHENDLIKAVETYEATK